MLPVRCPSIVNRLLDALPNTARRNIQKQSELVELTLGEILCEPGDHIRYVYFPTEGFISQVVTVEGDTSLEVALIGNEGMLGMPLVLGSQTTSLRAIVQGAGSAWRMQTPHFRRVLASNPALRRSLSGYMYVLFAQAAQIAACTCFHVLDARLARWLLMAHDRAHADSFYITHASLAEILGVRRSGVTTAAGTLQRSQLIHYSRGGIVILDRKGLERASCTCYRVMRDAYEQIFA